MQSINNFNPKQSVEERPLSQFQNVISPLAEKVHQFATHNTGSFFLLSSFFFILTFSPEIISWNFACNIIAYSLLSFSSLQIFTTLLGRNEFASERAAEQVNGLLGIVNFCVYYLFPKISLSSSVCTFSIGITSLLMRKLTKN
jgi:hypothetical protein